MELLTNISAKNAEVCETTSEKNGLENKKFIQLLRMFIEDPDLFKNIAFHSKYLTSETLKLLEEINLPKTFFQQTQNPKSRLVRDLIAEGLDDSDITKFVSRVMEIFIEEYEATGKITNWKNLSKLFLNEVESEKDGKKISRVKDKIFKYRSVPLFNLTPENPDFQELEKEMNKAKNNLVYILDKKKFGSKPMVKEIDGIINCLSKNNYHLKFKLEG